MKKIRILQIWIGVFCIGLSLAASSMGCGLSGERSTTSESSHLGGCPISFPNLGLCADITPKQNPLRAREESRFTVRFWKNESGSTSALVDPDAIEVGDPIMKCCGSPTGVLPRVVQELDRDGQVLKGVYGIENINVSMAGEWFLDLSLTEKGVTEVARTKFQFD